MEPVVIRASSLPDLFDCPARWEAKHVKKLRLPRSGAAQLGTAVHAGTALFDAARIQASPITVDDAAGAVVDAIHKPEEDVDWGEDKPQDAERIGLALHHMYCENIAPTQTYVAVEASCDRLDITDLGISLTGTADRVFTDGEDYGIADIKTGKRAVAADGRVQTSSHAAQVAVYELLASRAVGKPMSAPARVIGLQVAKTASGRRAAVGEVSGALELLIGDEDSPGLLEHAAGIVRSGRFFGNPRSQLCNIKFCPAYRGCRWRK